jgi:hypothetical protein
MLSDGPLAFREFAMAEPVPLTRIHEAVFAFLRGRHDVVLFGAQAVNAWVVSQRMTEDIDVMALDAPAFAEDLRRHLSESFSIAVRVRSVAEGRGLRLYQVRKDGNRHLVDVRPSTELPPLDVVAGVQLANPPALIALKVMALANRRGRPKSGTDWRDIAELLLARPALKADPGLVGDQLRAFGASEAAWAEWRTIVAEPLRPDTESMG